MDGPRGPGRKNGRGSGVEFEPAPVLPAQLFGNAEPDSAIMPEKRLLLAVLEEAVITYQRHVADEGRRGRRLFREAEEWMGSDDARWPCSFRNICEALGFDPAYIRRGLRLWRDRQHENGGPHLPHRHPFRRLSGSRTRAIGRPIGLGRRKRGRRAL